MAVESGLVDRPVRLRRLVQENRDRSSPALLKTVRPSEINHRVDTLGDGVPELVAESSSGQPPCRQPILQRRENLLLLYAGKVWPGLRFGDHATWLNLALRVSWVEAAQMPVRGPGE